MELDRAIEYLAESKEALDRGADEGIEAGAHGKAPSRAARLRRRPGIHCFPAEAPESLRRRKVGGTDNSPLYASSVSYARLLGRGTLVERRSDPQRHGVDNQHHGRTVCLS
jgi:hypothetical protein